MHEVITLQFGQQANYVGTHYWNTQESYFTYAGDDESPVDHDASFRPGIGADGSETYTPRTVIYDLKGAFGTLRRENALYELQQQENPAQGQWGGNTIPLRLPPITESPYQQALSTGAELPPLTRDNVRFWSDYNHTYYHPRSIVQLHEYELNSSLMPFEQWSTGNDLFALLDREHDLLDRDLRPFLEECDQLQGIQLFTSTDDAWGGFASKYLERLADDLGKGCRWVYGLHDDQRTARDRRLLRSVNAAQTLSALDSSASIFVPIGTAPASLPAYATVDASSRWSTAALQAVAIETATLPTRLRSHQTARATFGMLEAILNGDGRRRIAACSLSVRPADAPEAGAARATPHPDPRLTNGHSHREEDSAAGADGKLDVDLFPDLSPAPSSSNSRTQPLSREQVFSKISFLRGIPPPKDDDSDAVNGAASGPRTASYRTELLFPLLSSYPHIFRVSGERDKVAVQTSLTTSSGIAQRVRGMETMARRAMAVDEREALCDGLASIAEEYEEGWQSDDDSGEGGDD